MSTEASNYDVQTVTGSMAISSKAIIFGDHEYAIIYNNILSIQRDGKHLIFTLVGNVIVRINVNDSKKAMKIIYNSYGPFPYLDLTS